MRITERDRELLEFAAEHRLMLAAHARVLLDTSSGAAYQRLGVLSKAALLSRVTLFDRQPGCYQIRRRGLAAIGSDLPAPRLDLRSYEHDVGLAWLWLAARHGTFGRTQDVISERRMRSRDASHELSGEPGTAPYGVRLGGVGPGGRPRVHYPDLLLIDPKQHRIAVELELTSKSRTRCERILAGYGSDPRVDAVLYLCGSPGIERSIRTAAARVGVASLVHVQPLSRDRAAATMAARTATRARSVRAAARAPARTVRAL